MAIVKTPSGQWRARVRTADGRYEQREFARRDERVEGVRSPSKAEG